MSKLVMLLAGLIVVTPLEGQWRSDAFEPVRVTLDSVNLQLKAAQLHPSAAESLPLDAGTTAVIGATFGAAIAGGVWTVACRGKREKGCQVKWGLVAIGSNAILGAAVGWIIGEIRKP